LNFRWQFDFYFGQDLQDFLDYFSWITFRLPAIASRSGEAGGDESDPTQSAFSGNKWITQLIIFRRRLHGGSY